MVLIRFSTASASKSVKSEEEYNSLSANWKEGANCSMVSRNLLNYLLNRELLNGRIKTLNVVFFIQERYSLITIRNYLSLKISRSYELKTMINKRLNA